MEPRKPIKSFRDLEVYQEAFQAAMDIFQLTRHFPKDEMYSLTSQVVRSSRSVCANISEGWAKRTHENVFKNHLTHSLGSCAETHTWLDFALACNYLEAEVHASCRKRYNSIGKMLNRLHQSWQNF